ncbi:MAG: phosphotransferase family protein [Gammaproteobacteria bacterium]|nr:MAG: phosphotransferase family protein [Gammaproteobacteria bacterium]
MSIDQLDLKRIGAYLEAHLEGFKGLNKAEKFSDGQSNPTFLLSADSGRYVLRRQPPGDLLKSAHAVDREYRVMTALRDTDVPVPRTYHLCTDRDVLGSMFYVMSFENGRIFWDAALPDLDNTQRAKIYDEMNRVLAALHDIVPEDVGLADYGFPGNYFARQVGRWSKQYRSSETSTIADMDRLIGWLPDNMPQDDSSVSLIHGDYRMDNIMFHASEERAIALLDWELSTLGHPFADLAYQCMQWRFDYDDVLPGLGKVDRVSLGIPTDEQYVTRYCERRGLAGIPDWNFYLVFGLFRMAAIVQGILKRAIDGNASSSKAFQYGAMAPRLAAMAAEIIDQG